MNSKSRICIYIFITEIKYLFNECIIIVHRRKKLQLSTNRLAWFASPKIHLVRTRVACISSHDADSM